MRIGEDNPGRARISVGRVEVQRKVRRNAPRKEFAFLGWILTILGQNTLSEQREHGWAVPPPQHMARKVTAGGAA